MQMNKFIIFIIIISCTKAFSGSSGPDPTPNPTPTDAQLAPLQMMSGPALPVSYWIPVFLIIFGGLVIWVQYKYLLTVRPKPDVSLASFSLTLIITGTLVIISTGMNEKILGTAVGLFGTIAGYVLGRTQSGQNSENDIETEAKEQKVEVKKNETAFLAKE
jgi:hypothetical protein